MSDKLITLAKILCVIVGISFSLMLVALFLSMAWMMLSSSGFPNGTVDVFRGWVSSIGKAVTAKEVITRTVKVTNVGKPSVAEERSKITPVSAIKVTPTSGTVAKGKTTTLTVSFEPESATDKTFRAVYGAIAGCTFFIAREHTQAEYRWIEMFGHGKRMNMPWWGGFDPRAWDVASLMDFAVPVVACLLVWLLVNRG